MVDKIIQPLVEILKTKKGELKESHLILFEYCNLRCSFCHQDHESKIGFEKESMLEKVDTLIKVSQPTDKYVINITGGEIFLDAIPDDFFDTYFEIAKRLIDFFKEPIIVFGTNLVYNNTTRVASLIQRIKKYAEREHKIIDANVSIATSYDPAGRFTTENKELFFKNLVLLMNYVKTVNVVITKQNIESFLEGHEGDKFDFMCKNFNVYFDHYIPSAMYEYMQPSEDLIGQLYIHLNQKYPNSYPIKDWKNNIFNNTTCRSTKIINKDGIVTTCWSEAGKNSILDEQSGLDAKANAEQRFLEKYNCLACEYYTRCGLRCFLHHSFVDDKVTDCKIKEMFKVVLPA